MSNKPLFEQHADKTIERCRQTYAGRGTEYGDTWRDCKFLKMEAVAKHLGLQIDPKFFRALATAAFCDMKYWRFLGSYKDDNLIDGINYDAFLAEEVRALDGESYVAAACEMPSGDEMVFGPMPTKKPESPKEHIWRAKQSREELVEIAKRIKEDKATRDNIPQEPPSYCAVCKRLTPHEDLVAYDSKSREWMCRSCFYKSCEHLTN